MPVPANEARLSLRRANTAASTLGGLYVFGGCFCAVYALLRLGPTPAAVLISVASLVPGVAWLVIASKLDGRRTWSITAGTCAAFVSVVVFVGVLVYLARWVGAAQLAFASDPLLPGFAIALMIFIAYHAHLLYHLARSRWAELDGVEPTGLEVMQPMIVVSQVEEEDSGAA